MEFFPHLTAFQFFRCFLAQIFLNILILPNILNAFWALILEFESKLRLSWDQLLIDLLPVETWESIEELSVCETHIEIQIYSIYDNKFDCEQKLINNSVLNSYEMLLMEN